MPVSAWASLMTQVHVPAGCSYNDPLERNQAFRTRNRGSIYGLSLTGEPHATAATLSLYPQRSVAGS
jgi:hypothetical protein